MILGMICGRCSIRLEFGDGSSARWMASADASSINSVRRVKMLRRIWNRMITLMTRKMVTPRRIMVGDVLWMCATREGGRGSINGMRIG